MAGRSKRSLKAKEHPLPAGPRAPARPRPPGHRGRRPVKRWKSHHTAVAGGLGFAVLAFMFLLARSAQYSATPPPPTTDFTLVAYQGQDVLGGDQIRFSHVLGEGKPVVLNFFAGACAPCSVEMPGLQRVADECQGRAVFVGLDVGPFVGMGSHDDATRLLKQLGIRYPAGYAVDSTPLTLYVQGMPTTVVFDAKGQVVTKVTGTITETELQQALRKALGE